MKTKQTELQQLAFLSKYLKDDNEELLELLSSHIGHMVFEFNMLEERLTSFICQLFIDDIDAIGLIVTKDMNYSGKIDLLNKFALYYQNVKNRNVERHEKLINDLKESGRLRNIVVHAEWNTIDLDGFTYSKLRMKKGEMSQEFVQLNEYSLIQIRNQIIETYNSFDEYEEEYFEKLQN